jgi:hypothetical protein
VATNRTSPLDATGRAKEEAQKKNAKELAKRKEEIALANAEEAELLETHVFDPKEKDEPIVLDEIENVGVTTANDYVVIRTITDIEEMTYGVGNTYNFKAGVKYRVSPSLANYLERLGYIWRPN